MFQPKGDSGFDRFVFFFVCLLAGHLVRSDASSARHGELPRLGFSCPGWTAYPSDAAAQIGGRRYFSRVLGHFGPVAASLTHIPTFARRTRATNASPHLCPRL